MPRSIQFRYNLVFLPEYLSTIMISLPISGVFMMTPLAGVQPALFGNPHFWMAAGLYGVIALCLLGLTIHYRQRFCPVIFHYHGDGKSFGIDAGRGEIPLASICDVSQSLGTFFGRVVRKIRLEDDRGQAVQLSDAIFEYDRALNLLGELLNRDIPSFVHDEKRRVDRAKLIWRDRHAMFPASESLEDVLSRLSWRGVCLLPVAVVDVLINIASMLSLSKFQKHSLMVYSAPLSLLASGFIARYVYYYLFTSTTMNKPLGTTPGETQHPRELN